MQRAFARSLPVVVFLAAVSAVPAFAQVQLLGTGAIPGNVIDNSGLNRLLEDGLTPDNLVGGLGSAISFDATDIRDLKQLPETGTPTNIIAVTKTLFIDLLDPAFGLAGPNLPEKFEGMGFGPDLGDGRHR